MDETVHDVEHEEEEEERKLLEFADDLDFDEFVAKIDDEDLKRSLMVSKLYP